MRKLLCLLILFGAFSASAQRFVRYFDTVTDMAASNPADPNVYVVVGGSVSFNDNQAARWKWVSGSVDPADGNTVVSAWTGGWPGKPAGRWKKINEASGIVIDTSGFITNYNVVVVNDKASLQNINVTNNIAVALVKGKYGLNDGWEGQFTFNAASTAVADDAFYVAPNTGVGMWERQTPNPLREIPATWFDPNLTNGVIQAAINYAASLSTNAVPGREVLLPPKFIEINGNTGLNMSNNVTLVGQNGTVLATSAGTVAGYQMIRANGVTNWGVKNLQLIGLASVGGYGIFVTNSSVGVWGGITFATNFTAAPVWITNSSRISPFDELWTANSVQAFGAQRNNTNFDNTLPFHLAFANFDTNSQDCILVPAGRWYGNFTMAKEGLVLRGASRHLTQLYPFNTNAPIVTMGIDDGEFYRSMRVEHLTIGYPEQIGSPAIPTAPCGLRVQGGASKGTVFDCDIGNINGNLVEILGGTSTYHGGGDVTTAEISFFRIINSMLEYARGGACIYMNAGVSNRSVQLYLEQSDLWSWTSPGSKMAHLEGGTLNLTDSYWQGPGGMGEVGNDYYGVWMTNKIALLIGHNWNIDDNGVCIEYGWDTPQAPYTYLFPRGTGISGEGVFISGDLRYKGGARVNLSNTSRYGGDGFDVLGRVHLSLYLGSYDFLGTNWMGQDKGFSENRRLYGQGASNMVIKSGSLELTTPNLQVDGEATFNGEINNQTAIITTNASAIVSHSLSTGNNFKQINFQDTQTNQMVLTVSQPGDMYFQVFHQTLATNLSIFVTNQPVNGDWIAFVTTDGVETRIWTNDTPSPAPFFMRIGTNATDTAFNLYQYLNTYKLTNNDSGPVRSIYASNEVMYTSNPDQTLTSSNSSGWGYSFAYPTNVVKLVAQPLRIYNSSGEVVMTNQMDHNAGYTRLLNLGQRFSLGNNGAIGVGVDNPGTLDTYLIVGTASYFQGLGRNSTDGASGANYTIHAGGTTPMNTNVNGGALVLNGGIPSGTGTNSVILGAGGPGTSGTNDISNTNIATIHGAGVDVIGRIAATGQIQLGTLTWTFGSGAPSADAAVGSFYSDVSGGVGSTFYVKEVAGAGAGNWKVK